MNIDEKNGIRYRRSVPDRASAVLLLVHGLGGHSGRWQPLMDFFFSRSVASYALELKGFGSCPGLSGDIDSFETYYRDITGLARIIQTECPGKKIFLAGESMGGLLAFIAVSRNEFPFAGLICLSPAFKSRLRIPPLFFAAVVTSWLFYPRLQFQLPLRGDSCTRDPEFQKSMDTDGLEHHCATGRFLYHLVRAQQRVWGLKDLVGIPVLFQVAGKDSLVDPRTTERLVRAMKDGDKTIIMYPSGYHALSIDLERERVFADMFQWITAHLCTSQDVKIISGGER